MYALAALGETTGLIHLAPRSPPSYIPLNSNELLLPFSCLLLLRLLVLMILMLFFSSDLPAAKSGPASVRSPAPTYDPAHSTFTFL